ncbi:MAG: hypothetical protein AB1782_14620 [Cyanobacteriota bacterium]
MKKIIRKKQKMLKRALLTFLATALPIAFISITDAQVTPDGAFTSVVPTGVNQWEISSINPSFSVGPASMVFNRFTQFIINAGEQYDILLPIGSSASINIIAGGGGTNIAGTLRALTGGSGSPVGGNMIFIDPQGITVSGLVDAGSIMMSTSSATQIPLNGGGFADINNPADIPNLILQGVDITGDAQFVNPGGAINLTGTGIIQCTPVSPFIAGESGIMMFANAFGIDGTIGTTAPGASIALYTGSQLNFNLTNADTNTSPLVANGSANVSLSGVLNASDGTIDIDINTNDLLNNVINIFGQLNASAITPGVDGGEVNLIVRQPASGAVMIDNLSLPGPNILADGMTTGSGGSVSIQSRRIDIINGTAIRANNGATGLIGGNLNLTVTPGSGPVAIASVPAAFIEPTSFANVLVTDGQPGVIGTINFQDDLTTPGFNVQDAVNFPAQTYVGIASLGNVSITAPINVFDCFGIRASTINVDSTVATTGGDIIISSIGGSISIGPAGALNTGPGGFVALTRDDSIGSLTVNLTGSINVDGGNEALTVGNYSGLLFTNQVSLLGAQWGSNAGTYTATTGLSPAASPGVTASTINVATNAAPPPPPPPPSPTTPTSTTTTTTTTTHTDTPTDDQVEYEVGRDLLIQDNVPTETSTTTPVVQDDSNDGKSEITVQDEVLEVQKVFDGDSDKTFGDLNEIAMLLDICTESGEACNDASDGTLGDDLVSTLTKGYPYDNEFTADGSGLVFSYSANYHPQGLESFLTKIKYLEEKFADDSNQSGNNLMGYKHPPAKERIDRVIIIMQDEKMELENKRVNERRFNKVVKHIN